MKKLIALCALAACLTSVAQEPTRVDTPISYVSRNSDTLYLVDDNFGKMIASVWDGKMYSPDRDGRKPVIKFTSHHYILRRNGIIQPQKSMKLSAKNQLKK